mgnify:CR=1 FL=1
MSKRMPKRLALLFIILSMLISAISGCSKEKPAEDTPTQTTKATDTNKPDEPDKPEAIDTDEKESDIVVSQPKVLRWGTHWVAGLDPNYTTGEYTLGEAER